ncbi:hypothetical protein STEG23_013016 [Scotinomys teguina]
MLLPLCQPQTEEVAQDAEMKAMIDEHNEHFYIQNDSAQSKVRVHFPPIAVVTLATTALCGICNRSINQGWGNGSVVDALPYEEKDKCLDPSNPCKDSIWQLSCNSPSWKADTENPQSKLAVWTSSGFD